MERCTKLRGECHDPACYDDTPHRCHDTTCRINQLDAMYRQQLSDRDKRIEELAGSAKIWMERYTKLQALVRAYQQAVVDIRDAVLNGRGPLAEMEVDNDVINAVLGIIDDNTPATLDATTPATRQE